MQFIFLIFIVTINYKASLASDKLHLLKSDLHFAIMRHAKAPGTGDPLNFNLAECQTQRNLSPEGINQAKSIGKKLNLKFGKEFYVFTSEWCRCKDTAKYLDGKNPIDLPLLNSFFQNQSRARKQTNDLKLWLNKNLQQYRPLLLVTHQVNITELTGVFPGEGEILILKLEPDGKVKTVERLTL